jgi:hypothetical protein
MVREWTKQEKIIIGLSVFGFAFIIFGQWLSLQYSSLIGGLIIVLVFLLLAFVFLSGWLFTKIYKENFSGTNQNHHAIIIAHGKPDDISLISFPDLFVLEIAKDLLVYWAGIELIIKNFSVASQHPYDNEYQRTRYRIYHCKRAQNFIDIVNNPRVRNLWIFGHGNICNLFLEDGNFEYRFFEGTPSDLKKNFIAQLHCNNKEGFSLSYYLCENPERCWMTPGLHSPSSIRNEVNKILENQSDFF